MRIAEGLTDHEGKERTITDGGQLWLTAADGVRLRAVLLGAVTTPEVLVVLVPGFTGHADTPAVRRTAGRLARRFPVLVLELRGHGASGGGTTLGADEPLDVDAAVAWARARGVRRLAVVGFSLGGSVVLCQAGLAARRGLPRPDAVVAVSAPSRWYIRDTPVMRRLHPVVETAGGRLVARFGLRVRIGPRWTGVPPSPLELIGEIPPTPLLLVHGDRDSYFPVEHPHMLAAAAGGGAELRIVPGFGHAENALTPALVDELGDWLAAALAGRRAPEYPDGVAPCGSIEG
ncbi:MAG: hydrolase [Mycobacterium sp.]|nr:hydrolase [Mycobacterium sp.]